MLKEGDKAPDFALSDDLGDTIKLSKMQGAPVVVYFYPKDDTTGCTAEARDFSCLVDAFQMAGVSVIGISPDDQRSKQKFRLKYDLKVKLAADVEKSAAAAYEVWVEKSMYGKKYMGVERSTFLIAKDGKIARMWRKVKVPGHAEEVLEAAQKLAK